MIGSVSRERFPARAGESTAEVFSSSHCLGTMNKIRCSHTHTPHTHSEKSPGNIFTAVCKTKTRLNVRRECSIKHLS